MSVCRLSRTMRGCARCIGHAYRVHRNAALGSWRCDFSVNWPKINVYGSRLGVANQVHQHTDAMAVERNDVLRHFVMAGVMDAQHRATSEIKDWTSTHPRTAPKIKKDSVNQGMIIRWGHGRNVSVLENRSQSVQALTTRRVAFEQALRERVSVCANRLSSLNAQQVREGERLAKLESICVTSFEADGS